MKSVTCLLLIITLLASCALFVDYKYASTAVSGTFSSDTVNYVSFLSKSNPSAPSIQNIDLGPTPTPTLYNFTFTSPSTTLLSTSTPEPTLAPTPTPTPSSVPTQQPTKSADPLAQTLAEFDIIELAKIVLLILAIVWVIVIVVSVDRQFTKKKQEKP